MEAESSIETGVLLPDRTFISLTEALSWLLGGRDLDDKASDIDSVLTTVFRDRLLEPLRAGRIVARGRTFDAVGALGDPQDIPWTWFEGDPPPRVLSFDNSLADDSPLGMPTAGRRSTGMWWKVTLRREDVIALYSLHVRWPSVRGVAERLLFADAGMVTRNKRVDHMANIIMQCIEYGYIPPYSVANTTCGRPFKDMEEMLFYYYVDKKDMSSMGDSWRIDYEAFRRFCARETGREWLRTLEAQGWKLSRDILPTGSTAATVIEPGAGPFPSPAELEMSPAPASQTMGSDPPSKSTTSNAMRPRGKKAQVGPRVKAAMRATLMKHGRDYLEEMKEESMAEEYSASRDTCRRMRREALSEFV